jgi:hypothetical protein
MAALDASLYYSLGLGILFIAAYTLSNLRFEAVSTRFSSILGKSKKGESKLLISPETAATDASVLPAELSSKWWTDEEIFQLERRAIFSKVGKCNLCRHFSDELSIDMALRDACQQLSESWRL